MNKILRPFYEGNSVSDPTRFIYSILKDYIAKYQSLMTGDLVDIGCGEKPFKAIFENVDSYFGIDISHDSKADLVCDVLDIDIDSECADSVLCTQVLEHVEHPDKLLSEISRITKRGGIVIVTAPHICRVHGAPHDYFRFTEYGLKSMLERYDFEVVKIEGMGGFLLTINYLVNFFILEKSRLVSRFVSPVINLSYLCVAALDKNKNHPFNYIAVARKTGASTVVV